jgi:hypothetical protein
MSRRGTGARQVNVFPGDSDGCGAHRFEGGGEGVPGLFGELDAAPTRWSSAVQPIAEYNALPKLWSDHDANACDHDRCSRLSLLSIHIHGGPSLPIVTVCLVEPPPSLPVNSHSIDFQYSLAILGLRACAPRPNGNGQEWREGRGHSLLRGESRRVPAEKSLALERAGRCDSVRTASGLSSRLPGEFKDGQREGVLSSRYDSSGQTRSWPIRSIRLSQRCSYRKVHSRTTTT